MDKNLTYSINQIAHFVSLFEVGQEICILSWSDGSLLLQIRPFNILLNTLLDSYDAACWLDTLVYNVLRVFINKMEMSSFD